MTRHLSLLLITAVLLFSCRGKEVNCTYMIHPHEEEIEKELEEKKLTTIFLAGTIDMGNSIDWQTDIYEKIQKSEGRYLLYNPRQKDWDASRPGEMDYQVRWELEHLEKADYILMYIIGSSKSPVSLLEMGLHARSGKIYVVCENSYYRYDNVRITCEYYGVPFFNSLDELKGSVQ